MSQILNLLEDLNLPDICWKGSMSEGKHSTRFLESVRDKFSIQDGPTKSDTQLDLPFISRE